MSKAVRIHAPGGPEALSVDEVEVPAPSPGEVRLRQTAVGVNYLDVYHRSGVYPLEPLPHVIGLEGVGRVEALGEGVDAVAVGDRVGYANPPIGSYAEMRNMPWHRLVPIPDGIDDETAAAMLQKGITAEYLTRRTYEVRSGDLVLFHAAAGGVGLIACQWLAHLGATVIGTVGSPEKAELAGANGCHHVIDYRREDFVERVREITGGRGVDVVYDGVGKATFEGSLDCLRPRGLCVVYGNASGLAEPLDTLQLAKKGSLYVTRPTIMTYTESREELLASAAAAFDVVLRGVVEVRISHRLPLEDAAEAHRLLESRATTGSTILLPGLRG